MVSFNLITFSARRWEQLFFAPGRELLRLPLMEPGMGLRSVCIYSTNSPYTVPTLKKKKINYWMCWKLEYVLPLFFVKAVSDVPA